LKIQNKFFELLKNLGRVAVEEDDEELGNDNKSAKNKLSRRQSYKRNLVFKKTTKDIN